MRKISIYIVIIFLVFALISGNQQVQASTLNTSILQLLNSNPGKIDPTLQSRLASLQPGEMLTMIITLKDQYRPSVRQLESLPNRQQVVVEGLQSFAQNSQKAISALLQTAQTQGRVASVIPFWVFNGFSVTATADMIQELANRSDIASITPDSIDVVPVGSIDQAPPSDNLSAVNIPAVWSLGDYGQNVVVASMDTGVDLSHPDLTSQWRGGSNSWYDPYGQHPVTPTDLNGHGTWTMGVMVAGDASGTTLGASPQAQWISVKIFNDSGSATATAIHLGYQWLLDPDGNPATLDTPQVVNNSWAYGTPGCNLEFQNDLIALRYVGILPVFAAGNYGPGSSTSVSPANYPEAFAVGAVDNTGALQYSSSRGPSACGETSSIYPELVAPGVNVPTTDLYTLYTQASGTSIAAPHVSGVLALLLSAFPGISPESQAAALMNTSVDLGPLGPDNDFGFGMLDAMAAYQWLADGNRADPTPTPSPSPTPLPSPTPTPIPDVIFSDGFESGDFSSWDSAVTDGGRLSVSGQAALVGSMGMQALIDTPASIYVIDASPASDTEYHARFYFSPNSVSIPKRKVQDIFIGRSSSGDTLFRLQLQLNSGQYQMRGAILASNGKTLTTSWYNLNNSTNIIEMAWQAASSPKGSDGYLSLWLDGSSVGSRTGVSNGKYQLEEVWLGPQAVPSGTVGIEYFDAFASTHTTYIGP